MIHGVATKVLDTEIASIVFQMQQAQKQLDYHIGQVKKNEEILAKASQEHYAITRSILTLVNMED